MISSYQGYLLLVRERNLSSRVSLNPGSPKRGGVESLALFLLRRPSVFGISVCRTTYYKIVTTLCCGEEDVDA